MKSQDLSPFHFSFSKISIQFFELRSASTWFEFKAKHTDLPVEFVWRLRSAKSQMKTFKDSDQTLEAFHLLDEQRYCKGAVMIHYGFLLAELFQLFRNELSSKDIVSMLPKVGRIFIIKISFLSNTNFSRTFQEN
jgi:hypothetical protein